MSLITFERTHVHPNPKGLHLPRPTHPPRKDKTPRMLLPFLPGEIVCTVKGAQGVHRLRVGGQDGSHTLWEAR